MMVAKAQPSSDLREALLAAALRVLREKGGRGLTVADVLGRVGLGTRAFYRHFDSKDHLILAVFVEAAGHEVRRLQAGMAGAAGPVEAVAIWIDRRLDLAFDDSVPSDLRFLSHEAHAQMADAPDSVLGAYTAMLAPLVVELRRGTELGLFACRDPEVDAQSIQAVVWAHVEKHWATGSSESCIVRTGTIGFCLRAIGVDKEVVNSVLTQLDMI